MKQYDKKETAKNKAKIATDNTHDVYGYKILLLRQQASNGNIFKHINITAPPFYPMICKNGLENITFTIATHSWGDFNINGIEDIINRYQTAIKVVEWLEKFDWDTADIAEI